jgi:hypothetical protein
VILFLLSLLSRSLFHGPMGRRHTAGRVQSTVEEISWVLGAYAAEDSIL